MSTMKKRWPLGVPIEDVEAVDRHCVEFFVFYLLWLRED